MVPLFVVSFLGTLAGAACDEREAKQLDGSAFVTPLPAAGSIRLPVHPFDLAGKTIVFQPSEVGYTVSIQPLTFEADMGEQLALEDAEQGLPYSASWHAPLAFSFPFAGGRWSEVWVSLNGALSFAQPERLSGRERDPWPGGTMRSVAAAMDVRSLQGFERMIAAFWSKFAFIQTAVFVRSNSESLLVTWQALRSQDPDEYPVAGTDTFQARLSPDGQISLSYTTIADVDGIVGLFGPAAIPQPLDRAAESPTALAPVRVDDLGTALRFTFERTSNPAFHRILLRRDGRPCELRAWINDDAPDLGTQGWTNCASDPPTTGLRVDNLTASVMVSKLSLQGAATLEWMPLDASPASAVVTYRPLSTAIQAYGSVDLSEGHPGLAGNVFEVFHHPVVSKDPAEVLHDVYSQFTPEDELGIVLTDFRIDDLFGACSGTAPVNHKIEGIGGWSTTPLDGERFGSKQLEFYMQPLWVGHPLFRPTIARDELDRKEYTGHPLAVGLLTHEITHRWGIAVHFYNRLTGKREPLGDEMGHWRHELDTRSWLSVSGRHNREGYPEHSLMGGQVWEQQADGTLAPRSPPDRLFPAGYSALDLYLMGLLPPEQVPDTFLVEPTLGKVPVSIADIIAAEGPRNPPAVPRREVSFRMYLLHADVAGPDPAMLKRAQSVAASLARHMDEASGGRLTLVPSRSRPRLPPSM